MTRCLWCRSECLGVCCRRLQCRRAHAERKRARHDAEKLREAWLAESTGERRMVHRCCRCRRTRTGYATDLAARGWGVQRTQSGGLVLRCPKCVGESAGPRAAAEDQAQRIIRLYCERHVVKEIGRSGLRVVSEMGPMLDLAGAFQSEVEEVCCGL